MNMISLDEQDREENCPIERRRLELRKAREEEEQSRKARDAVVRRGERRNKVALIDQRVVEHFGPLKEAIGEFIASEVEPLRAENVALRQRCVELEARIETARDHASAHVDARIEAEVAKHFVAGGPLSAAIDEGWQRWRADDHSYVASLVDVAMSQLETKLADLERRLASHPGKLPMARAFVCGKVNYVGDIVVCDGCTYQATRDTAVAPPHVDWVCLAQAGRDAQSPRIRGAFDSKQQYRALDAVEFDKLSYIARRDDPGPIFGDGRQALALRGKTGDRGPSGPRGERGSTGPAGPKGDPGPQGRDGGQGPTGPRGDAGPRGESIVGPPGPIGPRGEKGAPGIAGPPGERGAEGPQGRLPVVKVFEPGMVFYQGDVVTHDGDNYPRDLRFARSVSPARHRCARWRVVHRQAR